MKELLNNFNMNDFSVLLFGEIHGTKELPEIVGTFLQTLPDVSITFCLEISSSFTSILKKIVKTGDEQLLKNILVTENGDDGRKTSAIFYLLQDILKNNVSRKNPIQLKFVDVPFDFEGDLQNGRDAFIAKEIFNCQTEKTIALLGNIHASKSKIYLGGLEIIPAGYLLKQKMIDGCKSIGFSVRSGTFYNKGVQTIKSPLLLEKDYFDDIVHVDTVTAAKNP